MSSLNMDLGVLEHQMHQAHRNAVQAELSAAGLQEVGHPLLLCIQRGGALPGRAGPEGAGGAAEHFAARSGSIPEIPGEKGVYSPGAGAWGRPEEPGAADRQGGEGGGRLLRLPAAGDPQNVHRLYHRGAGSDAGPEGGNDEAAGARLDFSSF